MRPRPDQRLERVRDFARSTTGQMAVIAGLSLPVLMMGVGIAVDYGSMIRQRTTLQALADAAAVAGAREIALANSDESHIVSVASTYANQTGTPTVASQSAVGFEVGAKVIDDFTAVQVTITQSWTPMFAHFFSDDVTPVRVTSTARVAASYKLCVLGLEEVKDETIYLDRRAKISATQCTVYSNSTGSSSIRVDSQARMTASEICSAGGVRGSLSAFDPAPVLDCPQLPDPLADRPPPPVGGCNYNNVRIHDDDDDDRIRLNPGVYCGGLEISGEARVSLRPGIYVIKDGPFRVKDRGSVEGDYVGFYLVGDAAIFEFTSGTKVRLTGPKQGSMAGLLFFEDRNAPALRRHRIQSNDARLLLGTMYLPKGRLLVDSDTPVADQSAYTAIVARKLELLAGPDLVLNSDYHRTDVPVPKGLVGGRVVLTK